MFDVYTHFFSAVNMTMMMLGFSGKSCENNGQVAEKTPFPVIRLFARAV